MDDGGIAFAFRAVERDFTLLQSFQTSSGLHTAVYSTFIGDSFLRGKAAGAYT